MAYVKFKLDDGTIVYIESAETPRGASGLIPGNRPGEHPNDQEAIDFDQTFQAIRKMAASMVDDLRTGFVEQPDEVSVSFGLKASAEVGGLVVARGGMEANYNVSLRWRHDKEEKSDETAEKETEGAKTKKEG